MMLVLSIDFDFCIFEHPSLIIPRRETTLFTHYWWKLRQDLRPNIPLEEMFPLVHTVAVVRQYFQSVG